MKSRIAISGFTWVNLVNYLREISKNLGDSYAVLMEQNCESLQVTVVDLRNEDYFYNKVFANPVPESIEKPDSIAR